MRSHLLLASIAALTGQEIPAAPALVPAVDDKGAPRLDAEGKPMMVADAAAGPALSEADAALLKQMSPEAQAAFAAALGTAVAADPAADGEMEGDPEGAAEVSADESQDAAMLAPVLAELAAMKAALEAAGIKVGAPKTDEAPVPGAAGAAKMDAAAKALTAEMIAAGASSEVAKQGVAAFLKALNSTRKDSATVTTPATKTPVTLDSDAIIKAAEAAASKRFDSNAAFVQVVRMDHAEVATVEQAATVMLTTIKTHLPGLAPMAEEALKGQRLDSLTVLYKQAEDVRRDSLLASQGQGLARVLAQADLGGDGKATGNVIRHPNRS